MTDHSGVTRRATIGGLAACTVAFRRARAQTAAPPVQVAVLAPISGPWARQGQMMRAGAEMGIDDINREGGVKALGGAKMELVVIDAGDSVEKATDAAKRMVAQYPNLIGGTGAWLSSFTLAVTEVTERAELPMFSLSYSDLITSRGFRYVFQTSPSGDVQAIKALPTFLELGEKTTHKRATTIGIVGDNTASITSFLKPIRGGELDELKLKLVVDEIYSPPLADATSIVQRVRSARPQILLLMPTNVPDVKTLLEKLSEYNLNADRLPHLGNGGNWGASELLETVGATNLQGSMAIMANWGGKGHEELSKRFMARSKEPWMNQDAIMTYIDMMVFRQALENAGAADRRKVADAIRAFDMRDGVAKFFPSGHLQFDEKGRLVDATLVVVQWQDGKPVAVSPDNLATSTALWPSA